MRFRCDTRRLCWCLARPHLSALEQGLIDRYGLLRIERECSALTRCDVKCQEAEGDECQCSCLGAHHGEDDELAWVRRGETTLIADHGDWKVSSCLVGNAYNPRQPNPPPVLRRYSYEDGPLAGVLYSAVRSDRVREGWPRAPDFACSACRGRRAYVWDHCHTHGYVRAPLCTRCNVRRFPNMHGELFGVTPDVEVDELYYGWCPAWRGWQPTSWYRPCSP